MRLDRRDGMAVYRFVSLPADEVDVLVSTRGGGASKPPYASLNLGLRVGDDGPTVVANRRSLFAAYGLPLERSIWARQVHADRVAVVGAGDAPAGSESEDDVLADTDALVTDAPGVVLAVTLADCVPVVIYDAEQRVVGLAHAGWGGTVRRISSRTVSVMRERWGSRPERLLAAIGPSIGPEDYEVGEDVIEATHNAYGDQADRLLRPAREGKAMFDLWAANALDLESEGVSADRIETAEISTGSSLDTVFTHRLEGATGRFIATAMLR